MYYYAVVNGSFDNPPIIVTNVFQSEEEYTYETNSALKLSSLNRAIIGKVWEHETSSWNNPTFRNAYFWEIEPTFRTGVSKLFTAEIPANLQKLSIDLSLELGNSRDKYTYTVEVISSIADGETPIATITANLLGNCVVFSRIGVTVTKPVSISYRLVKTLL